MSEATRTNKGHLFELKMQFNYISLAIPGADNFKVPFFGGVTNLDFISYSIYTYLLQDGYIQIRRTFKNTLQQIRTGKRTAHCEVARSQKKPR